VSHFGRALRIYRQEATAAATNESYDRLEEREELRERREKQQERALAHERAREIWDSNHRTTIGAGITLTPWKHSKAVDQEHAAQTREATAAQSAEMDAEVARRMRSGAGIAAIRRSARRGVA